jgi:hypothetical protein
MDRLACAQIATGQGETPAWGNAATAAGPQGLAYDAANGLRGSVRGR